MSKAPIDPIKIWLSAEAFRRTTDELSRLYNNGKGEVFLIPIWVNQAFALELYFKCLLTLKTPSPPRNTHRFDELFENLPKIEKARVVKYYNQLSKNDQLLAKLPMEAPEFSNELREVLKDGSEVFEKMRYAY